MKTKTEVRPASQLFGESIEALARGDLDRAQWLLAQVKLSDDAPARTAMHAELAAQLRKATRHSGDPVAEPATRTPAELLRMKASEQAVCRLSPDRPAPLGTLASVVEHDRQPPLPGVSLVAACMNRLENLLKVLPSWLDSGADEIVIVDWSSTKEVAEALADIDDPRLQLVRVDGERHWVLTHALNLGLRLASREVVFKLDCDIRLTPEFITTNLPAAGEFVRGFWKSAVDAGLDDQKFVNGTFGAHKEDLRKIAYYDERILSYGWDDTDLYRRLLGELGLMGRLIDRTTLWHVDQLESQRLENQPVEVNAFLGRFEPTEFEGAKNKFYSIMYGTWGTWCAPQDYRFEAAGPGRVRGRRTTVPPTHQPEMLQLAEVLAVRQLAAWASQAWPVLDARLTTAMALPRLLHQAHRQGRSMALVEALAAGRGVHFVRSSSGCVLLAVLKTLRVMQEHLPGFAASIVVLEADAGQRNLLPAELQAQVFLAEGPLIEQLVREASARHVSSVAAFEAEFLVEQAPSVCLDVSVQSLVAEAMSKVEKLARQLRMDFATPDGPVPASCLVTSLYDEANLLRLIEYLACVINNLGVFERLLVCYERRDGLLSELLCWAAEVMSVDVGRLTLLPCPARPTFETLFSLQALLPSGTLLVVANADIAFDGSLAGVSTLDLSRTVAVLSRWDFADDGRAARLIRLANGSPNTFSADAWVTRTPFAPDFHLDYPIGTMHCDSFINNQLSLSSRYTAVNPCYDVHVFHLHDARFNSSAQKQVRDDAAIRERYSIERVRNGDRDPVKGLAWSTLAAAEIIPSDLRYQRWQPKAFVVDMTAGVPSFGQLLVLHLAYRAARQLGDAVTVVKLRRSDTGSVGLLLARYQAHFATGSFLIDIDDSPYDVSAAADQGAVTRLLGFDELMELACASGSQAVQQRTFEMLAWPPDSRAALLRTAVLGSASPAITQRLWDELRFRDAYAIEPLLAFIEALPAQTLERRMLTPFIADDGRQRPRAAGASSAIATRTPRISLVTSLFEGREFLPGFLENATLAADEAEGELIIIDANADDVDAEVVAKFLHDHPALRPLVTYLRVECDPGLYACWQMAIEHARAPLISNANIDDRRSPLHTRRLVERLEAMPEYAGACGSISCVRSDATGDWFSIIANEVWFHGEGSRGIGFDDLFTVDELGAVRSRNVMHCMPVWRKQLHSRFGFFDEATYGTSADWAFWLQCAKAGERFYFDESAFGRYFLNPNSHNRRNDSHGEKELRIIADLIGVRQAGVHKH